MNHIKNDYSDIKQLQEVIVTGKGFVVSVEPDKQQYSDQHQAWNAVRAIKEIEYVDMKEIEKIEEYAIEHGVQPC